MSASLRDRAGRPTDQAPTGLGDTATIPSAEPRTHLIWSNKWGAWHKRCDEDGSARGYTNDILRAGIFETSTAMSYHDEDRNKAVPLKDARARLDREIHRREAELVEAKRRFCAFGREVENATGVRVETAIAAATRRAKTPKAVECEASQSGPKGIAQ